MKYKLTNNWLKHKGVKLWQIEAVKDFGNIKTGDLGGYVQSTSNLSQKGKCWIDDTSVVYQNALITGNAFIADDVSVHGNAVVRGNAIVYRGATITGKAIISKNANICGKVTIIDAKIYGGYIHQSFKYN